MRFSLTLLALSAVLSTSSVEGGDIFQSLTRGHRKESCTPEAGRGCQYQTVPSYIPAPAPPQQCANPAPQGCRSCQRTHCQSCQTRQYAGNPEPQNNPGKEVETRILVQRSVLVPRSTMVPRTQMVPKMVMVPQTVMVPHTTYDRRTILEHAPAGVAVSHNGLVQSNSGSTNTRFASLVSPQNAAGGRNETLEDRLKRIEDKLNKLTERVNEHEMKLKELGK